MVIKHFDYTDSNQVLKLGVWLSMGWTDQLLKWEPSEYDNIKSITESSDTLWQPDMSLYSSYIDSNTQLCSSAHCIVFSTGRVTCIPPCTISSLCKANFKNWPFDRQNCTVTMGTWVSPGTHVDFIINKTTAVSKSHLKHTSWNLISASAVRDPGVFDVLPNETYPSVFFNFIIERHSAIDVALILMPALSMIYNY